MALVLPQGIEPPAGVIVSVVHGPADQALLDAGGAVVKVLPSRGRDLGVIGATRTTVDGTRLVTVIERLGHLQNTSYVPRARRFSDPPVIEDLAGLELDEGDLDDIHGCWPGSCGLKLSGPEILHLRGTITAAGDGWKPATQVAFRRLVLARLAAYRASGHGGMAPYRDKYEPLALDAEFAALFSRASFLATDAPGLPGHLLRDPGSRSERIREFFYWSVEDLGGKPIISVTHVNIVDVRDPGRPEVLIASKQVFATHYLTGALGIMALAEREGNGRLLIYANYSRVDVLQGIFGGIMRHKIEGRIRKEAPGALRALRLRLENDR
jgi:hypothetical protein